MAIAATTTLIVLSTSLGGQSSSSTRPLALTVQEAGDSRHELKPDEIRVAAKEFVDSLSDELRAQSYYPDASRQKAQWELCTIVQQCPKPKYGVAVAELTPPMRTEFFDIISLTLSDESYKRILLQQSGNLLLGEMQEWAVSCPGKCAKLNDPDGLLPNHILDGGTVAETQPVEASWDECKAMAYAKQHTLWECDASPRMLHHANINTTNGRYYLGNVFDEPEIHARNIHFDFVAVYGSLEPGEPFGFRYSGHHFDLSFSFAADGTASDFPVFLGHNPLIVPRRSPPIVGGHEDYLQWRNSAGVPQFPDAATAMFKAAELLGTEAYVPLSEWDSTPSTGGLSLKGGRKIDDVTHINLAKIPKAEFDDIWALIDYTLEFSRGTRSRDEERDSFRTAGKLLWTSTKHRLGYPHLPRTRADLIGSRTFFYVQAETPELLYFVLVNSLFSLMLEDEPSNHWHSMIIPKSYISELGIPTWTGAQLWETTVPGSPTFRRTP